METFHLDWCPRATNAIGPRTFSYSTDEKFIEELRSYALDHNFAKELLESIEEIKVCYRTDGIFIFSVTRYDSIALNIPGHGPNQRHAVARRQQREDDINRINIIAHFIKEQLGHVHLYNPTKTIKYHGKRWLPIQKRPITLSTVGIGPGDLNTLAPLIADDQRLLKLKAVRPQSSRRVIVGGEDELAVLRLREGFSRLFDKTLRWIKEFKDFKRFGIKIFKSYLLYVALFFLYCAGFSVHSINRLLRPDTSEVQILLAGIENSLAILFVIKVVLRKEIAQIWEAMSKPVLRLHLKFQNFLNPRAYSEMEARIRKLNKITNKVAYEIVIGIIVLGPLFFSMKEVPNFIWGLRYFFGGSLAGFFDTQYQIGQIVSALDALRDPRFLQIYLRNVFLLLPMFTLMLYVIDVSLKRRRVIRALQHLVGSLRFGNVFNSVVINAHYRAFATGDYSAGSFDAAIDITEETLRLERKKRLRAQIMFINLAITGIVLSLAMRLGWLTLISG